MPVASAPIATPNNRRASGMTFLDREFQEALEHARSICSQRDSVTYPSMRAAHHVRLTMKKLIYIIEQRNDADMIPYMPTMDEVHRFMVSNPSVSTEMILDINKRASLPAQQ